MERLRMRTVPIEELREETEDIKTFVFRDETCISARPGQYVMVWVPGVDEVPMSLSTINWRGFSAVTVRRVGEATEALHRKKKGELIGVRGPFGNGFELVEGKCLLVGGGTGVAALMPLAEELLAAGSEVCFVVGGRSVDRLLFLNRLEALFSGAGELVVTTDDGSLGLMCFASEGAKRMMKETPFDMVYTCGPEPMMAETFKEAEKYGIAVQASLERLFKCAIGLCGSCTIGQFRVCADGPVFNSDQIRSMAEEFGKIRLDASGRRVAVDK
jgi:dihydroorotate dehydrogenase electron transfer subunit